MVLLWVQCVLTNAEFYGFEHSTNAEFWLNQTLYPVPCICFCVYLYEMTMTWYFLHSVSFHTCHTQYFLTLVYIVGIWVTQICQAILFLNWGTLSNCNICESDKTLLFFFLSFLYGQVIHKLHAIRESIFILLPRFHLYLSCNSCSEILGSAKDDAHMMAWCMHELWRVGPYQDLF